jgi:transposase InsO family protein
VKLRRGLKTEDACTMHRPVRKHFPRNPYAVNNVNDVWELDLMDVQNLAKYNDKFKYLLSVIDVFSKFLYIVPLKSKTGPAVASAFTSILNDSRKRPIWVRTDKGKEFLNKNFQDALKRAGIQFQVCKNPDAKCAIVERVHRTIRDKLYKYFTYQSTYRYIEVLPKFVKAYNDTVHTSTGMAPSKVTDRAILTIWKRAQQSNVFSAHK